MKKLIVMALAGMFVLAAVGSAMAAVDITGTYRFRGWYADAYGYNPVEDDDTARFYDMRARVALKAAVADNLTFNARFDLGEQIVGTGIENLTGKAKADFSLDYLNAEFMFPGTPVKAQLGLQDVSWYQGVVAKVDTRARAKFWGAIDKTTVGLAIDKFVDAVTPTDKDFDGYTLYAKTAAVEGWDLGILLAKAVDKSGSNDSDMTTLDLAANGKLGPAACKFEVAMKTGELSPSVDGSGFGFMGTAAMPVGPANLTVALAYASGDDKGTSDEVESWSFDRDSDFQTIIMLPDSSGYPYAARSAAWGADAGFSNGLGVQVAASYKAMPSLTLAGSFTWATQNEAATSGGDAEDYGMEIDATAKWQMYEKAYMLFGFGYFSPGDAFGKDADSAMALMAAFNLDF
jgi:hypothetical protein